MLNGMDLRTEYGVIRAWEKALKNGGFGNPKSAEEYLIKMKRDIREFNKRKSEMYADPQYRTFSDDYESVWIRKPLPDYIKTMEDAEEYFDEEERIEMIHYPWDCTGQKFTGRHCIFEVNGRFILYHRVDIDI